MNSLIHKWISLKYPQNYLIKNPLQGALIITLFWFGFALLYKPFGFHASRSLSYKTTMVIYGLITGITIFLSINILKKFRYFSSGQEWTLFKEVVSGLIALFGMGIAVYFAGFLIEPPANRWNFPTFFSSCGYSFLLGIIPFTFFSAINYRYLFPQHDDEYIPIQGKGPSPEILIKISSQLKKEELKFYPSELLYAESDGNYVIFYLTKDEQVKKEVIRNSINNIEQQLSEIPYFLRIHRAFIVNLKKVRSKHGNTLGYQIKLSGTDIKIPVSRSNTGNFNKLVAEYYK